MPLIKRLQLGEIHDQPWCPGAVRNGVTDFLQYSTNYWGQYTPLLPTICYFLQRSAACQIVDLCSGGSGPWQKLQGTMGRAFGENFRIVLTDRFPNMAAFRQAQDLSNGTVTFREEPIDACALPKGLPGFRTLFGAFHHFSPDKARALLQDAVDSGQGIGIFEMTDRRLITLLTMLTAPFFVLFHTPKISPFSWSRLFLTYLIPVIPLVVLLDGIISCLRSYSPEEMEEMTGSLTGPAYEWEIRSVSSPASPFPVMYTIGCPKSRLKAEG